MLKVMPALEAYAIANVATQNLFGGNPLQFVLGDLNATGGTGGLAAVMGPQPGVLTLKELLVGEYNIGGSGSSTGALGPTSGSSSLVYQSGSATGTMFGTPLEVVSQNFQNNFGNIIIGSVMTTAGFKIANKVLAKPKNKANKMLRQFGLGSTIQI
jgi:hypothetical protein